MRNLSKAEIQEERVVVVSQKEGNPASVMTIDSCFKRKARIR